ncbi:MAG: Lrp/AsnC family transcriptional regulator [Limnochordia bacterium]|nr:Lrp/AsnC family transcriptional regulator [Bacillota bacterium]HOB09224.1 Lrp/AsnC family transcriptional regulator [Limnochordia bacterium]NLH31306.1 Lrp/AsnC family transcriptional regulator [Bacillota bacterium]HPT93661.1 Lrp/AsnC family transcriptional regulator [Limnochordia bacterium]HPZ30065.1 Lrp/AsnC family transcriptional regulator [Limnochordia bacterium]
MERKLLEILERNSRISLEQLAAVLEISEAEVAELMAKLEQDRVVLGYHAVIDWEKANRELVTALIEVKVTPQRGLGFDNIAERIYQYPEVTSVFLMSGGFDLTVIIEGKTMKDVAMFVSQKLAPMEGVQSTATHFVLKKYKQEGFIFGPDTKDQRAAIWL